MHFVIHVLIVSPVLHEAILRLRSEPKLLLQKTFGSGSEQTLAVSSQPTSDEALFISIHCSGSRLLWVGQDSCRGRTVMLQEIDVEHSLAMSRGWPEDKCRRCVRFVAALV